VKRLNSWLPLAAVAVAAACNCGPANARVFVGVGVGVPYYYPVAPVPFYYPYLYPPVVAVPALRRSTMSNRDRCRIRGPRPMPPDSRAVPGTTARHRKRITRM